MSPVQSEGGFCKRSATLGQKWSLSNCID